MVTITNQSDKIPNIAIFNELSRKWAIVLIKDLFLGCKKFNDFLELNPNLSNKVLSDQLKRLIEFGYIAKKVVSITPLMAEYELTKMGRDLNKLIYEQFNFAIAYGFIDKDCPHFKNRTLEDIFSIKK